MESTLENEQSMRAVEKKGGDNGSDGHRKPSKSELLSSAKVVADAARRRGENRVDKAEVAGAAANLLQAASEYGKFEDKPLGKYMEKAENHLRQYHNSHSTTTTTTTNNTGTSTNHPAGKDNGHYSSVNSGSGDQDHHQGGGGKGKYADYIKLAEGLAEGILKKHSGGGGGGGGSSSHNTTDTSSTSSANTQFEGEHGGHSGSGSGNGYGQYVKMAGEFLKKH